MAVKRMSRKNASKRNEKKSTKRNENKSKKVDMGTAWCMNPSCRKNVKVIDGKVVDFKRRGGKTGKMLRGTGECGHKVFRIMPNNA